MTVDLKTSHDNSHTFTFGDLLYSDQSFLIGIVLDVSPSLNRNEINGVFTNQIPNENVIQILVDGEKYYVRAKRWVLLKSIVDV